MALPFILSLLGSGLAGAGTLAMSPLIAGAIGSGLGTAIQEKDLGAGIRSGLTAGLLGGHRWRSFGWWWSGGSNRSWGRSSPHWRPWKRSCRKFKDVLAAMPAGTSAVAPPALTQAAADAGCKACLP
jgi:hypothetical protein